MTDLLGLLSNYVLITALVGWATAQVLKTVIAAIVNGKFSLERMVGDGGMPSCHSACVCALTMAVSRKLGFASTEFAISFILAVIVIHDAMGVRRAAGEHAKVLNKMIEKDQNGDFDYFDDNEEDPKELKEFLGHTPLEVLCGALIGILVAMLVPVF